MNDVHYMSKSVEWETPQDFFDQLNEEFGFTLDVCASDENHKCDRYFTVKDNGLAQSFAGERVWCNPPYGKYGAKWIQKCATEPSEVAVMLIPARTDTGAWHEYIHGKAEVRFVKGRLKFNGHKNAAPFPCAVVIFRPMYFGALYRGRRVLEMQKPELHEALFQECKENRELEETLSNLKREREG